MKKLAVLILVSAFVLGSMAFALPVMNRYSKFQRVAVSPQQLVQYATVRVSTFYVYNNQSVQYTGGVTIYIVEVDRNGSAIRGTLKQVTSLNGTASLSCIKGKRYKIHAHVSDAFWGETYVDVTGSYHWVPIELH